MSIKDGKSDLSYADKAYITFREIMANKQRNMIEDITRANKGELFVLHFLSMSGTRVLPSELSVALQASTARISALLGRLEKKGQIKREIDKENRRNILVTITGAGRERAEKEMLEMKNDMVKVFAKMGKTDTEEFIRLTKRFFELSKKCTPK